MSEVNLQPIIDFMDERFSKVDDRLTAIDDHLGTLQTSVDGLTKIVKDFQDEHIILRRKVELLENWAKQVSEKVGIPLPQGLLSD